jgi:23S rRNA U2552 (ribose-2'-O)-methylase RlmE/FtsJ
MDLKDYIDRGMMPWRRFRWIQKKSVVVHDDISERMGALKESIHVNKMAIETIDNEDKWEYYKKIHNLYELVFTSSSKYKIPDSLTILRPLSRSYFKLIEMLHITNIVNDIGRQNIRTGHLCEGPGGFIEAAYYAVNKSRKKVANCYAMSLKATKSHVPGWKRAASFLKNNPEISILYGATGTGDILDPVNQASFVETATKSGKLHLVTGDGGFDFTINYNGQEKGIFPLLVSTVNIGLQCLAIGNGAFILKLFDTFEVYTQSLLYLLSGCFQKWTLYKPAMSRPCNSEQYFIGVGFIGVTPRVLDVLRSFCEKFYTSYKTNSEATPLIEFDMNIFEMETPHTFQNILYDIQREHLEYQAISLHRTVEWGATEHSKEEETEMWRSVYNASKEYCTTFNIPYKSVTV